MCRAMARYLSCLIFLPLIAAAVQVNFPLNLQFPPIARVGEIFEFQFAPTTFSSEPGGLQYSITDNPSWLSVNSESRTLSGTPHSDDVGTVKFTITAAGHAGAIAKIQSELLVSNNSAPTVNKNISASLSAAGKLASTDTVILKPSKLFEINFSTETFDYDGKRLSYHALLADRTPLPAWISFDGSSIRFTGTSPAPQSPQSFDILLIASDTPNFSVASLVFTIAISNHTLVFEPFDQIVNVTQGDELRIPDIKTKLFLDNAPVQNSNILSVSADLPPWLTFDNNTFDIAGKAPPEVKSEDLTVSVEDHLGDVAEYTIKINIHSELFTSMIGRLNATIGKGFEYQLPRSILAKDDEVITVDLASLTESLHFDPKTFLISGLVPENFQPQIIQCSVTATSSDNAIKDTQTFDIEVLAAADASSHPNGNVQNVQQHLKNTRRDGIIVGSVIGAICVLSLLVALILCLRRRRKAKSYVNSKLPRSPRKSEISRPTFIPYGWPDIDMSTEDLEKGKEAHNPVSERANEQPPKLDLNLATDRRDSHSVTESIDDVDTRILDSFETSTYGIHNDTAPSQHPHDSMKIATDLAKRNSSRSDTFRKHKRKTTTCYQEQIHRSSGLPVNRRINGMGHGRHTYSPSRSNPNLSSSRRRLSASSYTTTRCTSTFSTTPSAFPQSPAARKHTTFVTTPTEERRSIRVVRGSRRSSLADRRTIDEKRSSYIRKRASAQSPFFSAGTRASSSNYKSPPAFIVEAQPSPRAPLLSLSRNTIVRPNDDVVAGREKEIHLKSVIRKPPANVMETPKQQFPGSLRTHKTIRPYTSITPARDRVGKDYRRPGTAIAASMSGFARRASTRQSLRAYDLKASLNDLIGSKVFEDVEMSDSVYSGEEKDIEEAEKRNTIKASDYTLPPLNLNNVDREGNQQRDSTAEKRRSKRDSKRELKRTSERDPTPYYYLASDHEHGGKENDRSTYSLGQRDSPIRLDPKGKARVISSSEGPKPSPAQYSRSVAEAGKTQRATVHRASKAISHQGSNKERHSRRSIHSRTQSRHSGGAHTKKRAHSRSQSSAYPYFDTTIFESLNDTNRLSTGNAITSTMALPATSTKHSLVTRDLSGNLTFYGVDEEPTIEELRSSSVGFCTSNGQISATARMSRLASLHLSSQPPAPPPKSSKRETVLPSAGEKAAGLALYPQESPSDLQARERDMLQAGIGANGANAGNDGNGGVDDEENRGSRKTWGSLKSIMGRRSRWVSGGYWEKQGKEDKVFI